MKYALILLLVVNPPSVLWGQEETKRKTEISFSVSLQNVSIGEGRSSTSLLAAARVGFYIYKGLQFEPEAIVLLGSADPAYMLSGNLVYNFLNNVKTIPFLLAGYGIANTIPVYNIPIYSAGSMTGVLNLGFGIKSFISDNIALRGEYRFQRFSGQQKTYSYYTYSTYSEKLTARIHSFQFGIVIAP